MQEVAIAGRLDHASFERFMRYQGGMTNTASTYKSCLKQFGKWLVNQPDSLQPTLETIERYRDDLEARGLKQNTVHLYIIAVKQFFSWLEVTRQYPDIAKGVKLKHIDKRSPKSYFDIDQIKKILDGIDTSNEAGKRDYSMLAVMFTCGLRTVEISRARVKDVALLGSKRVLYVQGKGHKEFDSYVPLPDYVNKLLVDYLKLRGIKPADMEKSEAPLFASTNNRNKGQALSTRSIRRICKTAFIEAGFDSPKWTAHSTRHSTAINALKDGHSARDVQMLLRHRSGDTTAIYLHQIGQLENESSNDLASEIFS